MILAGRRQTLAERPISRAVDSEKTGEEGWSQLNEKPGIRVKSEAKRKPDGL